MKHEQFKSLRTDAAAKAAAFACVLALAAAGFAPDSALAQGAIEGAQTNSAAAGTMIVAGMETAGYHAQAQVLEQLGKNLETMGALIFLGVTLSALLTAAMLGNYRPALYMLVGPSIFFFASGIEVNGFKNRIDAAGTEWRFGPFRDTEKVKEKVTKVETTPASVSYVFHKYNVLISEISQKLIEVLTQNDMKKQMLFMARQRTMEDLFGGQLEDSGVGAIAAYFMVECSTELGDARIIAIANRDKDFPPEVKGAAIARFCDRFPKRDKELSKGPWMDFVYTLPDQDRGFTITRQENLQKHLAAPQVVSCVDLWNWTLAGTRQGAARIMERAAELNFEYYSWKIYNDQLYRESIDEILKKVTSFTPLKSVDTGGQNPCPNASATEINPANQLFNNQSSIGRMQSIVAAMLVRKVINTAPSSVIFQRTIQGRDGIVALEGAAKELSIDPRSRRAQNHREKEEQFAEARKFEAYTLIQLLPYIQGFLLYVLGVTYPFFCLLLVIPGQAGGFFTWMALWTWAKSWDVGWAMVMIADGITWELFPKTAYYNPDTPSAFTSPINLLEGAYGADPAYSVASYWLLLSMMVLAVPIVSAHAVLGSKRAIASRLIEGNSGLQWWSDKLSGSAEDYLAGRQVGKETRRTAQARLNHETARSTANYMKSQQASGALGRSFTDSGNLDKTWKNAINNFLPNANKASGGVSGFFLSMVGISSAPPGGASGGEGAAGGEGGGPPGSGGKGGDAAVAADAASEQQMQESQAPFNVWGELWKGRIAANSDFLAYKFYGTSSDGVPALSEQRLMGYVFDQVGIDPNETQGWTADPELNKQLTSAFNSSLFRNAVGSAEAFGNADAMALISMVALPANYAAGGTTNDSVRNLFGYMGAQRGAGYTITQNESILRASLQSIATEQIGWEAFYDPKHMLASEAEAYLSGELSNGRGGEFFAISVYNPDLAFRIQRATDSAEKDYYFEVARAHGNMSRWAFQIWAPNFQPIFQGGGK